MSKSFVFCSVLLSGSLCFVGVQLGNEGSSTVVSHPVSRVEPVSVSGPAEPYIVEYDITGIDNQGGVLVASRIWSDGTIEARKWEWQGACNPNSTPIACGEWRILPGSSDGYACRSDIDGNRQVDFDDLLMVISDWSQPAICNPHPDIECGKPPFHPPA